MGFLMSRISCRKRSKFRGSCNGVCFLLMLVFFVYNNNGIFQNPFSKLNFHQKTSLSDSYGNGANSTNKNPTICTEIYEHSGYSSECEYLRDNPDCNSGGFLNYMMFFYCDCEKVKPLGYLVLGLWLLALFYLLGNTAADYFCCCLEMLSDLLKLPPTVAGVTLLPLGNGAPDVFASIAAFTGRDSGDVGLNSVLGGAVFVTCVVVGTISLCIASKKVQIDKKCFIRDVAFFIIVLVSLLTIMVVGEVGIGGAMSFVLIYVVYAVCVAVSEIMRKKHDEGLSFIGVRPLVGMSGKAEEGDIERPLLPRSGTSDDVVPYLQKASKLPHWMWASHVAIYSGEPGKTGGGEIGGMYLWGWNEGDGDDTSSTWLTWSHLIWLLELPLAMPRKLTIPIVEEGRWSKTCGVACAFLSPVLLASLWSSADHTAKEIAYLVGGGVGATLGLLALILTRADHPPAKFLFPWVLGGFLMSIVWFYIIANELVALLVGLGSILKIKPALLALTIMAWGNSMGDLMSNVAIALNGGDGVQVAMSGCYAGPMFNILIGLGISLLIGAWSTTPISYVVPKDNSLYLTLGFLTLGLTWSLVILPRNDMRPSKLLGAGLMMIYLAFLSFRVSIAMTDGSIT